MGRTVIAVMDERPWTISFRRPDMHTEQRAMALPPYVMQRAHREHQGHQDLDYSRELDRQFGYASWTPSTESQARGMEIVPYCILLSSRPSDANAHDKCLYVVNSSLGEFVLRFQGTNRHYQPGEWKRDHP
jgi:hypothetical protein